MATDPTPETDVLVVGAGPTGLTLAIQARLMGARVRILERRAGPRAWAPALAVHSRTLEILRGLGVADEVVAEGVSEVQLRVRVGEATVEGSLHHLDLPDTEYPLILFVPQPAVEAVLRNRLTELGVDVEWETEFTAMGQGEGHVRCQVRRGGADVETISARYLAGCDGRESAVRQVIGVQFRGRRYRESLLVADAGPTPDLAPGMAHAYLADSGIAFFFPLPSGQWRIIAPSPGDDDDTDLPTAIEAHTEGSVRLGAVDWSKTITPHHRVAAHYRRGRVFLAGDAAHTHSPAGAQGMNTGIQDAANLGWKLALAARGAPHELLGTYEQERRPVARQVVWLTGLAYALEVSGMPLLRMGRRMASLPIARLLLSHRGLLSIVARVVSGLDVRYRRGAISTPGPRLRLARPGTRLPDALLTGGPPQRLHRLIDGTRFHVLVFDDTQPGWDNGLKGYRDVLTVHRVRRAQLPRRSRNRYPGVALIRPDGYVAAAASVEEIGPVCDYLGRWLGQRLESTVERRSRYLGGRASRGEVQSPATDSTAKRTDS